MTELQDDYYPLTRDATQRLLQPLEKIEVTVSAPKWKNEYTIEIPKIIVSREVLCDI